MALTTDEAVSLALKAEDLFQTIKTALRKDTDGKVRLDPVEAKKIIFGLTLLSAAFAKEYAD